MSCSGVSARRVEPHGVTVFRPFRPAEDLDTVRGMVLSPSKRTPALGGVDLYRRLDKGNHGSLINDPARIEEFVAEIRNGLVEALSTPSIVRGWRAQALFASMVAALDGCVMLAHVDLGEMFFDGEPAKAPDFFLHLRDGRRILVDVKDVAIPPGAADRPITFSASEIARLRRFGELYGATVHLALYIAAAPMWTLVDLDDLVRGPGGGFRITLPEAIMRNKTALLGDLSIGVAPPLELLVRPDDSLSNAVDDEAHASFTVGSFEVLAGGRPVRTEQAQQIVLFLMMHGRWPVSEHPVVEQSRVVSLTWRAEPEETLNPGESFEIVGALSEMYARLFELGTRGPAGITALDMEVEPGALVSVIPHDYESADLPLWRFIQRQNDGASIQAQESDPAFHAS